MRRDLAIFLAFERDTGNAHSRRDEAINDYAGLLTAMGKSETEVVAKFESLRREVRLEQG
jgi:hypothetical protein